jgi:hypothetical protein
MKKVNKIFSVITISIFILMFLGIAGTYLSDYLSSINWFGDYKNTYYSDYKERNITETVWGARHYWYNWGISILFIVSVVRAITKVIMIIDNQE